MGKGKSIKTSTTVYLVQKMSSFYLEKKTLITEHRIMISKRQRIVSYPDNAVPIEYQNIA